MLFKVILCFSILPLIISLHNSESPLTLFSGFSNMLPPKQLIATATAQSEFYMALPEISNFNL